MRDPRPMFWWFLCSTASASSVVHLDMAGAGKSNLLTSSPNMIGELWVIEGLAVGTPPQTLRLMVDTGSVEPWAYLADCTSPVCECALRPMFDPDVSATWNSTGVTELLTYGGGGVLAEYGKDLLTVTANDGRNLALSNFLFAGASEVNVSSGFPTASWCETIPSGVLGLREEQVSTEQMLPRLKSAGLIPNAVMGFLFGSTLDEKGWATLGGVDKALFTPPIWWQIAPVLLQQVTLDGLPAPNPCASADDPDECPFTNDSGGAIFSAPVGMLYTIGADCAGIDQLPTIGCTLTNADGEVLQLAFSPEVYVHRTPSGCISGLKQLTIVPGGGFTETPPTVLDNIWQLSGRALSVLYTVVDFDNTRDGIAVAKSNLTARKVQ